MIMQANLIVHIYPLASSPDTLELLPNSYDLLTASIYNPSFILSVTIAACNGKIEKRELSHIPDTLRSKIKTGGCYSREVQLKALDVLLWMGSVHCVNAESGGYLLVSDSVGHLLVSLLYSCFIGGDRALAYKCSRLMMVLYK